MTEWMKQVCEVVAGLDLERPEVAVAALEQAFPEFEVLRRQRNQLMLLRVVPPESGAPA